MSKKEMKKRETSINKRSVGATNKRKGSDAERFYVKVFKDLGFDKCITSRLGGRIYDNSGIDLMNIPFNIQIKSGKQKNLNPGKELLNMCSQIELLFPENSEVKKFPKFVIHRKQVYRKDTEEDIIFQTLEQHDKINAMLKEKYEREILFDNIKIRTDMEDNSFGKIVSLPFDRIKNYLNLIKDNYDL